MIVAIYPQTVITGPAQEGALPTYLVSSAYDFDFGVIIQAVATNGTAAPTTPCNVLLQLTTDNVTWQTVDQRRFAMGAGAVSRQIFRLADYAGNAGNYGSGYGNAQDWILYRLQFGGNFGQNVTVYASSTGTNAPTFPR